MLLNINIFVYIYIISYYHKINLKNTLLFRDKNVFQYLCSTIICLYINICDSVLSYWVELV